MTRTIAESKPDPPRVKCAICRFENGLPTSVAVARPEDELVLLVEVRPGGLGRGASELMVELDRGEQVRHRVWQRVDCSAAPVCVAMRLHWGQRPEASSRLTCRLFLDGQPVGRRTVLLMPDRVDAQGRFRAGQAAPPSEHTRIIYENAFQALLAGSDAEPAKTERP
jgi:hypothetical protein